MPRAEIHYRVRNPKRDLTGLKLVGRHRDGAYQYESVSVLHDENIVNLTHRERVGLAVCYQLCSQVYGDYSVYPMTRNGHGGFGTRGGKELWLNRQGVLDWVGSKFLEGVDPLEAFDKGCLNTLCHEIGHNYQSGGKPHGPEFRTAMKLARKKIRGWLWDNGWPKLNKKFLEDSVPPRKRKAEAKEKRIEKKRNAPRSEKWQKAVVGAERALKNWNAKLKKAEREASKWEKQLKHRKLWLAKSELDETQGS